MELKDKKIIVTGAGRGMGAATLKVYVEAGANVIAMDIKDDLGRPVCEVVNKHGPGSASYVHIDVADKQSVTNAFAEALDILGGLDVLANPAGIQGPSDAGDVSVEDWELMFSVNTTGTMLTNQTAYKYMKETGGGSIINFGSISGQRPEPGAAAYSAAKGAVHSWTRTAAGTWGKDNVRVNAILPAIATPMFEEAVASLTEEENKANYWINFRNIFIGGKYGDAEKDLGPVMVFFASDSSRFITGQLIPVDGGQTNVS